MPVQRPGSRRLFPHRFKPPWLKILGRREQEKRNATVAGRVF
jgi:hypothetical protein